MAFKDSDRSLAYGFCARCPAGRPLRSGVAGLAAAAAVLVGIPALGAVGVCALLGFHLTLGWKAHKMAHAGGGTPVSRRAI